MSIAVEARRAQRLVWVDRSTAALVVAAVLARFVVALGFAATAVAVVRAPPSVACWFRLAMAVLLQFAAPLAGLVGR